MNLLPMLSFLAATSLTPGPNNLNCAALGMEGGYKKALPFILGVYAGVAMLLFVTGLLRIQVESFYQQYRLFFLLLGTAYLFYLAGSLIFKKKEFTTGNSTGSFVKGWMLQVVNPKGLIFIISLYSLFFTESLSLRQILLISTLIPVAAVIATSIWALAGSFLSRKLKNLKARRIFYLSMGLLLVYTAVSILIHSM